MMKHVPCTLTNLWNLSGCDNCKVQQVDSSGTWDSLKGHSVIKGKRCENRSRQNCCREDTILYALVAYHIFCCSYGCATLLLHAVLYPWR